MYPESHLEATPKSALKATLKKGHSSLAPTLGLELTIIPGVIQHHLKHRLLYHQPCTKVVFIKALYRHLYNCYCIQ